MIPSAPVAHKGGRPRHPRWPAWDRRQCRDLILLPWVGFRDRL